LGNKNNSTIGFTLEIEKIPPPFAKTHNMLIGIQRQFSALGAAATTGESRNADVLPAGIIRAEHIALNVLDPAAAVKW